MVLPATTTASCLDAAVAAKASAMRVSVSSSPDRCLPWLAPKSEMPRNTWVIKGAATWAPETAVTALDDAAVDLIGVGVLGMYADLFVGSAEDALADLARATPFFFSFALPWDAVLPLALPSFLLAAFDGGARRLSREVGLLRRDADRDGVLLVRTSFLRR